MFSGFSLLSELLLLLFFGRDFLFVNLCDFGEFFKDSEGALLPFASDLVLFVSLSSSNAAKQSVI
jgi:hypothetical protein